MANNLHEKREFENYGEKERLRLNAMRYGQGWRFAQQLSQPNLMFRNLEYYIDLLGVPLNTAAFLNTIEMLGDEEQVAFWRK